MVLVAEIITFVFDILSGGINTETLRKDLYILTENLVRQPKMPSRFTEENKVKGIPLGGCVSFRYMIDQLSKRGLFISKVCRTYEGDICFTASDILHKNAEDLFEQLTKNTGWQAVRHNNLDGSTNFRSTDVRFLSEEVPGRDAGGLKILVPRHWDYHQVNL